MGALSHLCPIQCLPQGACPPRDAFSQKGRRNSGFSAAPQLPVLLAWAVGFHHIPALSWDPHQAEIPDPKGLRAFEKRPAPGNVEGLSRGSYSPALPASFPLCLALLPPLPNWFHASLHCSVVLHPSHPPGPPRDPPGAPGSSTSPHPPSYLVCVPACSAASVVPTLCNPMDYRLPGSSVHGIL